MRRRGWVLLVVAGVAAAAGGILVARGRGPESPGGDSSGSEVSVPVGVAEAVRKDVAETVEGFGSVTTAPGQAQALSVPFECRVRRVHVTPGQVVKAGTALVEVEPSADTRLAMDEAKAELESARAQAAQVRDRLGAQLATRQDLIQAEQQVRAAELKVRSLSRRHAEGPRTLVAGEPGTVGALSVQAGQVVAAGVILVEVVTGTAPDVRLGIELADAPRVVMGQAVSIERLAAPGPRVEATVRLAARRLNPETRLVDVFVQLPPGTGVLLGEPVRGRVRVGSHPGLVVPRSAVVPEGEGFAVFTIDGERARAHAVTLGTAGADEVEILGDSVRAGQLVVTVGAPELRDGMRVEPGRSP